MANSKKTLTVAQFRGVDLAGNPTAKTPSRADWALNMVTDGNGYPETRKGYAKILQADGRINGIHVIDSPSGARTLVHHGTKISEWKNNTLIEIYSGIADRKSFSKTLNDKMIILDGKQALVYSNWSETEVEDFDIFTLEEKAYIPRVLIGGTNGAIPGGTPFDNVNLISDYQKNEFCIEADVAIGRKKSDSSTAYEANPDSILVLSDAPVDDVKVERLTNGTWVTVVSSMYIVDKNTGKLTFNAGITSITSSNADTVGLYATELPGADNYRVTFKSSHESSDSSTQKVDWSTATDIYGSESTYTMAKGWYTLDMFDEYEPGVAYSTGDLVRLSRTSGIHSSAYYYIRADITAVGNRSFEDLLVTKITSGKHSSKKVTIKLDNSSFSDTVPFAISIDTSYKGVSGRYELPDMPDTMCNLKESGKENAGWIQLNSATSAQYYANYCKRTDGNDVYVDIILSRLSSSFLEPDGFDPERISLSLIYTAFASAYKDRVNKCTFGTLFGYAGNNDRMFISGNSGLPNQDFWSDFNNPLYFPDQNRAVVGDRTSAVMGYSWLSDGNLAIHKSSSVDDSTMYIRTSTMFNGTITFAIRQGSVGIGVVAPRAGVHLNGDSIQLAESGVFAMIPVQNIAIDDRYAVNRSYFINPLLMKQDLSQAEGIVVGDKYYLAAGDYVFVADSTQKAYNQKGTDYGYEWYIWDNIPVRIWHKDGDRLYFGSESGAIYEFTDDYYDDGVPVKWEWETPWLDFNTQTYYKKIKSVVLQTATKLWQTPHIEYIFPIKPTKDKPIPQTKNFRSPFMGVSTYKAKKISLIKLRISGEKPCGLSALSILYTVSGKFKGMR